jgi:hypothetical protein
MLIFKKKFTMAKIHKYNPKLTLDENDLFIIETEQGISAKLAGSVIKGLIEDAVGGLKAEDSPVYDPNKSGGYLAGEVIAYINSSSPIVTFRTLSLYLALSDIPMGVSPEDTDQWKYYGEQMSSPQSQTCIGVVSSVAEIENIEYYRSKDTVILQSIPFDKIYKYDATATTGGIKPKNNSGAGRWLESTPLDAKGSISIFDGRVERGDDWGFLYPWMTQILILSDDHINDFGIFIATDSLTTTSPVSSIEFRVLMDGTYATIDAPYTVGMYQSSTPNIIYNTDASENIVRKGTKVLLEIVTSGTTMYVNKRVVTGESGDRLTANLFVNSSGDIAKITGYKQNDTVHLSNSSGIYGNYIEVYNYDGSSVNGIKPNDKLISENGRWVQKVSFPKAVNVRSLGNNSNYDAGYGNDVILNTATSDVNIIYDNNGSYQYIKHYIDTRSLTSNASIIIEETWGSPNPIVWLNGVENLTLYPNKDVFLTITCMPTVTYIERQDANISGDRLTSNSYFVSTDEILKITEYKANDCVSVRTSAGDQEYVYVYVPLATTGLKPNDKLISETGRWVYSFYRQLGRLSLSFQGENSSSYVIQRNNVIAYEVDSSSSFLYYRANIPASLDNVDVFFSNDSILASSYILFIDSNTNTTIELSDPRFVWLGSTFNSEIVDGGKTHLHFDVDANGVIYITRNDENATSDRLTSNSLMTVSNISKLIGYKDNDTVTVVEQGNIEAVYVYDPLIGGNNGIKPDDKLLAESGRWIKENKFRELKAITNTISNVTSVVVENGSETLVNVGVNNFVVDFKLLDNYFDYTSECTVILNNVSSNLYYFSIILNGGLVSNSNIVWLGGDANLSIEPASTIMLRIMYSEGVLFIERLDSNSIADRDTSFGIISSEDDIANLTGMRDGDCSSVILYNVEYVYKYFANSSTGNGIQPYYDSGEWIVVSKRLLPFKTVTVNATFNYTSFTLFPNNSALCNVTATGASVELQAYLYDSLVTGEVSEYKIYVENNKSDVGDVVLKLYSGSTLLDLYNDANIIWLNSVANNLILSGQNIEYVIRKANPYTFIERRLADATFGGGGSDVTKNLTVKGVGVLGGYKDGDVITIGTTLTQFIEKLLVKPINPITSVTISPTGIQEIGSNLVFTITPFYTKNDGGDVSLAVIKRDSLVVASNYVLVPFIDTRVVTSIPVTYTSEVTHDNTGIVPTGTLSASVTSNGAYYNWFGANSAIPSLGLDYRLYSKSFSNVFTLNTGTIYTTFFIALPAGKSLVSVVDIDAADTDITSVYLYQGIVAIPDGGGVLVNYSIYAYSQAVTYSTNHRHVITTN